MFFDTSLMNERSIDCPSNGVPTAIMVTSVSRIALPRSVVAAKRTPRFFSRRSSSPRSKKGDFPRPILSIFSLSMSMQMV